MGLILPLTIKYKIEMVKLHKMTDDWDTGLEGNTLKMWIEFLKQMVSMSDLIFDRSAKLQQCSGKPEMSAYCNGGKPVFGAVV